MEIHYQHSRYVDWNAAVPLKIENSPSGMMYVNEYIADGSKLGFGSVLYHCKLGNEVTIEDLATCIDLIAGDKVTFGKSARFLSEYMAHRSQVPGRCAQFGDHAIIAENSLFERFAIFGNYARIGRLGSFESSAHFGDDGELGELVQVGSHSSFGRNLRVKNEVRFDDDIEFANVATFGERCWFGSNCTFGDETNLGTNPRLDISGRGSYDFGKNSQVKYEDWRTGKGETMNPYTYLRRLQQEAESIQGGALYAIHESEKEKAPPLVKVSKTVSPQAEIVHLNIPGIGSILAQRLLEKFGTLENIRSATKKELMDIDDIGRTKASRLLHYFKKESTLGEQQK